MCFVWVWEQTAFISLYSINWLVCITETESVYCAVRTGSLYIIQVMCFVWIWEQTAIISLYNVNWLVFITEMECVYCAARTRSLYIIQVMCFVRIWEQTAIISVYSISWFVFITETECVYCAVRTGSLYIILRSSHTVYFPCLTNLFYTHPIFPITTISSKGSPSFFHQKHVWIYLLSYMCHMPHQSPPGFDCLALVINDTVLKVGHCLITTDVTSLIFERLTFFLYGFGTWCLSVPWKWFRWNLKTWWWLE